MTHKTREELVAKIQELEIRISELEKEDGEKYGNQFPKILKLVRQLQKLRDQL